MEELEKTGGASAPAETEVKSHLTFLCARWLFCGDYDWQGGAAGKGQESFGAAKRLYIR